MIPVLITGAGPTGLALAMWLTRLGVKVRIIDKTATPGTTSRAIGLQARTLEYQRQLGLAEPILRTSYQFRAANLWVQGERLARMAFGELGADLSPYPILPYVMFQQDQYERLMVNELLKLGVDVERNTELLSFQQDDRGVTARLTGGEVRCAYLCGCDGAHSRVRHDLGIPFPGSMYPHVFFVADVRGHGPALNGELHMALNDKDFFGAFPVKSQGRARLIGTIHRGNPQLTWEEAAQGIHRRLDIAIEELLWFSTYKVHNRIAPRYRVGRCFILGDAAHVHSPVAGQGMNTGIGDAVNLSWKLAAALRRGDDGWLDTYQAERINFARALVWSTDQAFRLLASDNLAMRKFRCHILPRAVPFFFRFRTFRRWLFRYISQTHIHYRRSPLSWGRAGSIHGGDRLPWMDNFDALQSLSWQVHVYGRARPELRDLCAAERLPLHEFAHHPTAGRDALYLVRPDGHVALAEASGDPSRLREYLTKLGPR